MDLPIQTLMLAVDQGINGVSESLRDLEAAILANDKDEVVKVIDRGNRWNIHLKQHVEAVKILKAINNAN